jgi:hypothetical protein
LIFFRMVNILYHIDFFNYIYLCWKQLDRIEIKSWKCIFPRRATRQLPLRPAGGQPAAAVVRCYAI